MILVLPPTSDTDRLPDLLQAPMPTALGWLSQPPPMMVCGRVVSTHDAEIIRDLQAALELAVDVDVPIALWPVAS